MKYIDKYNLWLNNPLIDSDTKLELEGLNEVEIEKRFYKDLTFGTAGIRGNMGAGSNYINNYTIGLITQGLANYINKKNLKKVVIAYDSRYNSLEFAKLCASILNNNNIETYIFDGVRATPILAYAVK